MSRYAGIGLFCALLIAMLVLSVDAETLPAAWLRSEAASFINLLDEGRYPEAWQMMSPIYQVLDQETGWQDRQRMVRDSYGALIKREFHRMDFRDHYRLSPDGQYIVVQFKASFQYKAKTMETVVFDCTAWSECSVREYIIH